MNNSKYKKSFEKVKIIYINFFNLIILLIITEIILGNWLTRKPIVSKIPAAKYNVSFAARCIHEKHVEFHLKE